jgi:hypothetical protein
VEKYQLERREKIAETIVLAAMATGVGLQARKGDRVGLAQNYPSGSFYIDVYKDEVGVFENLEEKYIRISGRIKSLTPLKLEIEPVEHSDSDLDVVQDVFEIETPEE